MNPQGKAPDFAISPLPDHETPSLIMLMGIEGSQNLKRKSNRNTK